METLHGLAFQRNDLLVVPGIHPAQGLTDSKRLTGSVADLQALGRVLRGSMDAQAEASIGERLKLVLEHIGQTAQACGRGADSVRLVAATKTVSIERIREAIAAGLSIAGENRLQEALPKIEGLRSTPIRWHFIGQLQRRKARSIVGVFDLIHSVDSLDLAQEIDRRAEAAGIQQDILLEINVAGEATKTGFGAEELERQLPEFVALRHVPGSCWLAL